MWRWDGVVRGGDGEDSEGWGGYTYQDTHIKKYISRITEYKI